ncbi:MAG: hypothetical protein ACLFTB_00600 [Desulfovibrionales bacterium]
MTHSDFSIGLEFISGEKRWRCTDVGTRTIVAVCLSDHPDDESWYNGPPYAVAETVFDEYDLEGCSLPGDEEADPGEETSETGAGRGGILAYLAKRDEEITTDELTDIVCLRHQDGSMFLLANARLEIRGEWLLLFAEHHTPQLFHKDDVTQWISKERSTDRDQRRSTWRYQAYRHSEGYIQIYEDYFDESGAWHTRTAEPIPPMGESAEELASDLYHMLSDALVHPVKDLDDSEDS